ncbi:MAG: MCP four helix bundle domain-containing protein [Rhodospirillaceae bacterium]|nr:MCP four helix bundle domain-containing protein [Rhodospirillaceae bacterium]
MNFMKNMKIGSRLYTMLAVQLVALLAVAAVAVATMHKIGTKLTDIAEEDIPLTEMIQKITVHQLEQAILAEQAIAIGSAKTGKAINSIEDVRTKFDALAKKVDGEILKAEEIAQHGI